MTEQQIEAIREACETARERAARLCPDDPNWYFWHCLAADLARAEFMTD